MLQVLRLPWLLLLLLVPGLEVIVVRLSLCSLTSASWHPFLPTHEEHSSCHAQKGAECLMTEIRPSLKPSSSLKCHICAFLRATRHFSPAVPDQSVQTGLATRSGPLHKLHVYISLRAPSRPQSFTDACRFPCLLATTMPV